MPESSTRRTGRVPSDRRAAMMSNLSAGMPLAARAGAISAICGPLTSAATADEPSRQSRL